MSHPEFPIAKGAPKIVGSFGTPKDLSETSAVEAANSCHIAEIRLDLLLAAAGTAEQEQWEHLSSIPLLFTARRQEEGGALAMSERERMDLLRPVIMQAAMIDIEVASIDGMQGLLDELKNHRISWIASFHDFEKLPANETLETAAKLALEAGASCFKAAARLQTTADLSRLAEFQLADHGLPVATMGMGPLAPVSRLLCAQCGSVLNYGFLGKTATAPGQWDAALLGRSISRLAPFHG